MRQTIKYEFWVGLFLLLGIAALVFLGLRVANVQGFGEQILHSSLQLLTILVD